MGVSKATVSRVLRRAGLSKLSDLRPQEAIQRYEREAPGELLHIDIKKLGRFEDVGHRITGDYRRRTRHVGWEYVFVAVDDHSRVAFTAIHPDERKESAVSFLRAAVAYYAKLGVAIQRVITDNGPAFHSAAFAEACLELGIAQKFTRAYRPQTNGKAERFIQSALREWAYGRAYGHSDERRAALPH
jgi:transposase InsO family protein